MHKVTITFTKDEKQRFNKCFCFSREDIAQGTFFSLVGLKDVLIQLWNGSKEVSRWPRRQQTA